MAALDFAPFASLKALLQLEKAAITDYPQLGKVVDRVKQAFETYLGYHLDLDDYTYSFFQNTATRFIYLTALPIVTVDSVVIDLVEWSDYKITDHGIMLPTKISAASVTTTHNGGYDSTNYPPAIEKAAVTQVCYEFGSVDNIGSTITTTDGGTVQRPELGLLKEVQRMLTPFQSPASFAVL